MDKISVVIPCFNHGRFIDEAIKSIKLDVYTDIFELIVVDDGSTDLDTIKKIAEIESRGIKVIRQSNKGLGASRNKGVSVSTGKYILPLDCDNLIVPEVFIEARQIMEANEKISIIYTNVHLFGDKDGDKLIPEFNIRKLIMGNYIDACALIRKDVFMNYGGYAEDMPYMGHEDWELWIRLGLKNINFKHLDKFGFWYRVRKDSMLATETKPGKLKNWQYIYSKYSDEMKDIIAEEFYELVRYKNKNERYLYSLKSSKFKLIFKILIGRLTN
mgnify:CR=1 FL=1